ncbi:Orn/Lys/Arg decarboxylase N-terminal domain-containing protein [Acidocella sp.]|uniref:Orn/Lys/Arg family decarboxylase n=1 Tax=Acidocella sp. TaxID=50710 RepID=UPI00261BDDF5|nr:Orn/Lys/Arg decarboxylase N-terminal domain-containing protein [Acidocella sp.]
MPQRNIQSATVSVLIVNDAAHDETAAGRAIRTLATALGAYNVLVAAEAADAMAIIRADASLHAAIIDWDLGRNGDHMPAADTLAALRRKNADMPVFLLAERTRLAEIPVSVMQQADDFIWLLEDTVDFIAGRIIAAMARYEARLLPPMLRALVDFSKMHEYSWHTPGHTGGTAFLKSPAGRVFHAFFGENLLRADLSISVGELGSLLDHSGPIGAGEAYAARVFGADRTYYVTNGTSTSNRIVVMAAATQGQVVLCDRNCHKSIEHAMTLSGAMPVYLMPSRNHLGIIGPIRPALLRQDAIRAAIAVNPLTVNAVSPAPVLAILTNSTYDGLCYDITQVEPALGASVDRILFDEAWFAYARFHPLYAGRFAMHERAAGNTGASVFATQSTHKLLAALSQASMIHMRDGRRPVPHERFNEAFMMHASTSPQYAVIASNDVSAAMMEGPAGTALIEESIQEAIAFRQMMARMQAQFTAKDDWFFGVWQPDSIDGGKRLFHAAPPDRLAADPACWVLAPHAEWHGFGDVGEGYCMLDPIKVSIVMPRMPDGLLIPAPLVTAYLDAQGIIPEKTTDFTILFLFSLGITKGKWGTLVNALLDFKRDFDADAPLARVIPALVAAYPARYGALGLRELAGDIHTQTLALGLAARLEQGFSVAPVPVRTPAEAYRELVAGYVERLGLEALAGRVTATGIVPYPPGIPLAMPGEDFGPADGPVLGYLRALEAFDALFPGFTHDIHGIEVVNGRYNALCLAVPV